MVNHRGRDPVNSSIMDTISSKKVSRSAFFLIKIWTRITVAPYSNYMDIDSEFSMLGFNRGWMQLSRRYISQSIIVSSPGAPRAKTRHR